MKLRFSQNIEFGIAEIRELILSKVLEKAPELSACLDEVRMFFFNEDGDSVAVESVLVKMDKEIDA